MGHASHRRASQASVGEPTPRLLPAGSPVVDAEYHPKVVNLQAVYYRAPDGTEPVNDFIDRLDAKRQVALDNQIDRLNMLTPTSPHLPFPHSSQVSGELTELRCHYGRELYRMLPVPQPPAGQGPRSLSVIESGQIRERRGNTGPGRCSMRSSDRVRLSQRYRRVRRSFCSSSRGGWRTSSRSA
jgi:hypothetical protein